MRSINKVLFKAICEGKWVSIEYKNKTGDITKYWIAIKKIYIEKRMAIVDGFHVFSHEMMELLLYIDQIQEARIIQGSYYERNQELIDDINNDPTKYQGIFDNLINLKILDYLSECNRLDSTPYSTEYALIAKIDDNSINGKELMLSEQQFADFVEDFQARSSKKNSFQRKICSIGMNLLSINTKRGLYVLAYMPLYLDVKNRKLIGKNEAVICKEFTISGNKESIRNYIDEGDMYLLDDFFKNAEAIRNIITDNNKNISVDDMPYIVSIGRDCLLNLDSEYKGILDMYSTGKDEDVILPIKAFFGDLTAQSHKRKSFPFALIDNKINLDQLLAINNAMRTPITYVQGPPGTGKTQTIVHAIITAFFNERSVLFTSYNNHPIDGVVNKLESITYRNQKIPFPVVRLGNNEEIGKSLEKIKNTLEIVKNISVYDNTLLKNKKERTEKAKKLTKFLENYEQLLDLQERKDAIEYLLGSSDNFNFQTNLQALQLNKINKRIDDIGKIDLKDALQYVENDTDTLLKYLFYTSAKYYKLLFKPEYAEFISILYMDDKEKRVAEFNKYISNEDNLIKFSKAFPVIATTCISAHKLGEPKPLFDIVIIDEASQSNIAVSLVPIIRGHNLMLVGDPQQLSPVVLLSETDNGVLRKKYNIPDDYDYIKNSLYKAFLACDSVNDEVLLRTHYRCNPAIIEFNNKKYYNDKLIIKSSKTDEEPLLYVDIKDDVSDEKNIAPAEIDAVLDIISKNRGKEIGIITPFVKQREAIQYELKQRGIENVECGTVHAFQGDEKDIILFSLALTDITRGETYNWLKNNRELINVATSRAKNKLVVIGSKKQVERLHSKEDNDDIYELINYVMSNGKSTVTKKISNSRALGIRPYSSETEEAFTKTLNHALENAFNDGSRYVIHKEVGISHVFLNNKVPTDYFYKGRFDFVVCQKTRTKEIPVLAIELDGKEHRDNEIVRKRDRQKEQICRDHGFELIRVENSYARRYHYIKDILTNYFSGK